MIPLSLLLEEDGLELIQITENEEVILLHAKTSMPTAACPVCQFPSGRIRSRYLRSPADLPMAGKRLVLRLTLRKFHCDNEGCPRRIFCERLPNMVAANARMTLRLTQAHLRIALAAGGEGGAKLTRHLGMPVSGDTLLRRIRSAPLPKQQPVQVLGVDDWAYRRGRTYGTLLCDLERRCPVDLLPDRTSESLSAWLKEHPEITIISRDRASDYSQGATAGAPQATQVADRWHLLKNLRDALKRLVDRFHSLVRETAKTAAASPSLPFATVSSAEQEFVPEIPTVGVTSPVPDTQIDPSKWRALYQQVVELHRQQISQREIAKRVGLHRETVGRYLKAETYPEPARRGKPRSVDPHLPYLKQRWEEGCRNASQLFEELKNRGFRGSYYAVSRCVANWREPGSSSKQKSSCKPPSASSVAWLLFQSDKGLEEKDQQLVDELQNRCPAIKQATELAREFVEMVRERQSENWTSWFDRATDPDVSQEIRNFALGLKADESAVKAALSLQWSNGQVEGQINRLKNLKRQMYGRGSFELLRKRVLLAA